MVADRYKLIKLLGEDGTGKADKAEKIATQQRVAIKLTTLRQVKNWRW